MTFDYELQPGIFLVNCQYYNYTNLFDTLVLYRYSNTVSLVVDVPRLLLMVNVHPLDNS